MLLQAGLIFVAFLCYFTPVNGQGTDLTRQEKAAGSKVVETVVGLIQESSIFPSDNTFLRRVAYVESKDGTESFTYRAGYDGGIWQIDQTAFLGTMDVTSHPELRNKYSMIASRFGIEWTSVLWSDLRKPIYSGLAARLFLFTLTTSIPFGVELQASYWISYYNTNRLNRTATKFVQDVSNLEKIPGKFMSISKHPLR